MGVSSQHQASSLPGASCKILLAQNKRRVFWKHDLSGVNDLAVINEDELNPRTVLESIVGLPGKGHPLSLFCNDGQFARANMSKNVGAGMLQSN